MNAQDSRQAYDGSAMDYDRLAREYRWLAPEALFGLCFEYVRPGERLLAIGIGTGLCASPFAKAGLQVFGLDASPEMLNICRSKSIAAELRQFDIRARPWPYPDGYFDHVIACGVLHFLDDLAPVFQEAARVVRMGGLCAFTTKAPRPGHEPEAHSSKYSTEVIGGVTVFSHRKAYLEALMASCGFEMLKDLEFLVGVDQTKRRDLYLALVTCKTNTGRRGNVETKN
jgi:ubiquinone/menaquinone biosynthesis C-methylase UbiE